MIRLDFSEMEVEMIKRFCDHTGITIDELVDMFLRWVIREPEAVQKWFTKQ